MIAALVLLLRVDPAEAQDAPPIIVKSFSPTEECTVTCRMRLHGDEAIPNKQSAEKLLSQYGQAKAENEPTRLGAMVYEYGAKFGDGLLGGAESTPVVAGVSKVLLHGMEEYSRSLKERYDEAVRKQLLIEADRQVGQNAIDPNTGRVNVEALKKGGSLDWIMSDEFYSKIEPSHRDALNYARGNLQITMLTNIASTTKITAEDVKENGKKLDALGVVVKKTEGYVVRVGAIVEREKHAIDDLSSESSDSHSKLIAMTTALLPPREKLALAAQGVVQLSLEEQQSLSNQVEAQDMTQFGEDTAHAMRSAARLLGDTPAATDLEHLAEVAEIGAKVFASYLTGNVLGMATGAMDLIGAVSAFGPPKPSPEVQMLKQILAKLDEIEKKIDKYHEDEMKELTAIHDDLRLTRTEMLANFEELEIEQWDALQFLRQIDSTAIKSCEVGASAYHRQFRGLDQWSLESFDNWLSQQHARDYYGKCVDGLGPIWQPYLADFSMLLVPISSQRDSDTGDVAQEVKNARFTLQTMVAPMLDYLAKYNLWGEDRRKFFRDPVDSFDRLREVVMAAPEAAPGYEPPQRRSSLVTDRGGHLLIDTSTALALSAQSRTILEWTPVMWVTESSFRAATKADIQGCSQNASTCNFADWRVAVDILNNDERVVRWLVEQEQLIAGLPAVVFAADVLERDVLSQYSDARSKKTDGKDLQASLT